MTPVRAIAVAAALVGLACACGGSPPGATYTFHPRDAAVKVNSPALRKAKAAAGIDPCPATRRQAAPVSGGLPDITLPCLGGGRAVDLAGLRGKPTLVNFWSQTCPPCRSESPLLQQLHQNAGRSVRVLGIDWEDPRPAAAIAFAKQLGLTYPQLADPDAATRGPMRVQGLPMTVFVSRAGSITYTQYGAVTSAHELDALVRRHLGVALDGGKADAGVR